MFQHSLHLLCCVCSVGLWHECVDNAVATPPPPPCRGRSVGLWHESVDNAVAAKEAVLAAVGTAYAQQSGDYMASLANVHARRRCWLA